MIVPLYLCFLVFLLWVTSFREGFESSDEYEFLKPHDPTVLDDTTENDFITAFNTTTTFSPQLNLTTNTSMLPIFEKDATLEEFKYYIKNNKWPYGVYLTNYITINTDATLKSFSGFKISTLEELQQVVPSRTLYDMVINPIERTQSPLPASNEMFTGKSVSPSATPSTSASSLSPDNFTKLKEICSSV